MKDVRRCKVGRMEPVYRRRKQDPSNDRMLWKLRTLHKGTPSKETLTVQSLDPADKVVIALSTCPDEPTAKRIATAVVEERLATCVNRVSGLSSTYFWDGRLQDESEILLIIKTSASRIQDLQERLEELHPYELAEFIVLPVIAGNEAYLQWVREGVEKERRTE